MNVTRENVDELNAILKVKIEKPDYEEKVGTVLKDYRKKAQIPGFRPGKVPFGMVKKMYGKAVLVEEVNKLISESISKYMVEEKLHVLGDPLPNESQQQTIDWDHQEEFEFVFDLGLAPEFEIKLTKRDKVPFYDIKVDDKFINDTIENHAKRFGSTEDAEVVEDNELLKGTLTQLDQNGEIFPEGILKEEAMLSLEVMKDDDIKAKFKGAKVGDEITFNLKKAYPNDTDVAAMLSIEKEVATELDSEFKLNLTQITKFITSEINQELFDKVYEKGTVGTEEEFRNKIHNEIKENFVKESNFKFAIDAKDKIVAKTKFEIPADFLKRWLKYVNKDITDEQIENEFDKFVDDLKWTLIKDKITLDNDIKVEDDEVLNHAKEVTLMQFRQYGLATIPDEQLENYAKEILKKPEEKKKMADKLFEDKVVNYIKENIKLDSKEVTTEEFKKLFVK